MCFADDVITTEGHAELPRVVDIVSGNHCCRRCCNPAQRHVEVGRARVSGCCCYAGTCSVRCAIATHARPQQINHNSLSLSPHPPLLPLLPLLPPPAPRARYAVLDAECKLLICDPERLELCVPFAAKNNIKTILCRGEGRSKIPLSNQESTRGH